MPTLEPLVELNPRYVRVTHGRAVTKNAREVLERAIRREPWQP